jgi:hypothetical protein
MYSYTCIRILYKTDNNHSVNDTPVIHAFLFDRYISGKDFMFLEQRGLANFPIIKGLSFWDPSMFAANITVIRFLLFLSPWYFSFLNVKVRFGKHL